MELKDKTALVTGGAQGIGQAIVRLFLREGARVVLCDLNRQEGEALARELEQQGGQVLFVPTNVMDSQSVQGAIQAGVDRFGGLDILVNNAGIVEQDCYLEEESEQEWNRVLSVNLHGTFLACKYALPHLRQSKGCVVNIASISGLTATRYCAAYCASKAGVIGLTRAIAADYAPYGVRANAVCPASCLTPMMKNYFAAYSPEQVEEKVKRLSGPIGRMCQPEEIARAVLFLASPQASYVSGSIVPVDGGYTAV